MYFTESHMLVSVSRWIFLASSWRLNILLYSFLLPFYVLNVQIGRVPFTTHVLTEDLGFLLDQNCFYPSLLR